MHFDKQKEAGSVIIFTLLILGTILASTLALTNIFIPKIKVANEAVNSVVAIYAADSVTEFCLYIHRKRPQPQIPDPNIIMQSGAQAKVYVGSSSTLATCYEPTLDYRIVGTYRGVSRSFQVN